MFTLRFTECLDVYKCFYGPILENMFCKSPLLAAAVKKKKIQYAEPVFLKMLNLQNSNTFFLQMFVVWMVLDCFWSSQCFYFLNTKIEPKGQENVR